jgi:hypothetical protein
MANHRLRVVALLEAAAGDRHDPRLFVRQIDLIRRARRCYRRCRRPASRLLAGLRTTGLARRHLGLILGLLARKTLLRPRLDDRACPGDLGQALFGVARALRGPTSHPPRPDRLLQPSR